MADDPNDLAAAGRHQLRRALGARLGLLGRPLRIVAEDMLGEDDARIDWLAVEPDGRAVIGLLEDGTAAELLAAGLAQRSWAHARLPDWRKLSPDLGIEPELRPRLLLVAGNFPRLVVTAAAAADPDTLALAQYRVLADGEPLLEIVGRSGVSQGPTRLPGPRLPASDANGVSDTNGAASFRSGLTEADLEVGSDDRTPLP